MLEIITCIFGTLGFCVVLGISANKIIYAVIGGAVSSVLFVLLESMGLGIFLSTFIAMTAVCVYSEISARVLKTPSSIILLPATIPLLPGGSLYYMMSYLVRFDFGKFIFYAKETALTGFGIALGTVFVSLVAKLLKNNEQPGNERQADAD